MSTLRQKKLAKAVVENISHAKPLNKQELVVSSGYAEITADRHATEVLESKGVQEELKKYGFDSDTAKSVVAEILIAGENDNVKLKAADMIFKVNSDYAPEKSIHLSVRTESSERLLSIAKELNERRHNPTGTS